MIKFNAEGKGYKAAYLSGSCAICRRFNRSNQLYNCVRCSTVGESTVMVGGAWICH